MGRLWSQDFVSRIKSIFVVEFETPENKQNRPFLWAENEYVIGGASSYIYLVLAANDLLKEN